MTMGFEAAGWECVGHAEIEPHARAVLRHKWPDVPLHGDVAQLDGTTLPPFDLLTFGAPCQDLSIAGKRAGMTEGSGTRSSLFFEAIRIWKESTAPLALYENVLGAYSSNDGKDFAAVLSAFVGAAVPVPADGWRGAGVASGPAGIAAWRTLDLQHFGWNGDTTPQRRRRVFVLGTRTGSVDPAEVLLVADGLRGHLATSGEAGEGTAEDAVASVDGASGDAIAFESKGSNVETGDIAPTLRSMNSVNANQSGGGHISVLRSDAVASVDGPRKRTLTFQNAGDIGNRTISVFDEMHPTLRTSHNSDGGVGVLTYDEATAFNWQSGGDPSPTLTGLFTPAVVAYDDRNQAASTSTHHTLRADGIGSRVSDAVLQSEATAFNWQSGGDVRLEPRTEQANTLQANQTQAVILRNREGKPGGGKGPLVSEASTSNDQVVFTTGGHAEFVEANAVSSLRANGGDVGGGSEAIVSIGVPRRLMPSECEALMSWPRNHTAVGVNEKGESYELSDTARYKLCGNGVGSAVTAWIGMRLKSALDTALPLD
jgi:DNA-cytosine methyltransferase